MTRSHRRLGLIMWAILAPLCLLIIVAALNTSPHTPPQAAPAAAFRGDR